MTEPRTIIRNPMRKPLWIFIFVLILGVTDNIWAMGKMSIKETVDSTKNANISDENNLMIFYLPFVLETYMPVTTKNIESLSECKKRILKTSKEASALTKILDRPVEGSFDRYKVRLKIKGLSTDPVYIDQKGGCLIGVRPSQLSKENFKHLENLMEFLCEDDLKHYHNR